MSHRVSTLLEHHLALEKAFPVKTRRAQDIVKDVVNRAEITKEVSPHLLRHTFAATAL
jgi:integrase/recombinase XerD